MPVLEQIDCTHRRTEPLIWIKRLALFESLDPLVPIRKPIEFSTGLNIIWGIEDDSVSERFEPGHGVGKTTLCRLIRYCLGESAYGQEHAAREIRHTFPDGYVAAEIQIQGRRWSVLRPFDQRRADCAKADVTINELLKDHPPRESFKEFYQTLATTCLTGLRTESILTGGASFQWGHLLAMCTRDQEARYQSLWQWRSPRSASETPKFTHPKPDALLCLRAVMGLLPDEETELQQRLHTLDTDLGLVETEIVERSREPDYWARHCRRSLYDDYGIADAHHASLEEQDMHGLPRLVKRRIAELEQQQQDAAPVLATLRRQISYAAAALQEPAELQEQEHAAADITDDGTETLLKTISELRQLQQDITDAKFSLCKYGQIAIGNCTHATQQLQEAGDQIRETQLSQLPVAAQRDQAAATLRERAQRKAVVVNDLRSQLSDLLNRQQELNDSRRDAANEIKGLKKTLAKLIQWEQIRLGLEPDSKLVGLTERKQGIEEDQTRLQDQLTTLLAQQDERIIGVRQVYEALVRATLSPDFKGRVKLSRDGLEFQVFRGENLSGEAFETLSILLADLAVLLMGALATAAHPGLLIHDSPREADLGQRIYERLLHCTAEVARELRGTSLAPFQYIVTTTTPPPRPLRKKPSVHLKLGGTHGPLFGKQLHAETPAEQQNLTFDDDPAEGAV